MCPVGSSCSAPYEFALGGGAGGYTPIDPHAAGPLVTDKGVMLLHAPVSYAHPADQLRDIFRWSPLGIEDLSDNAAGGSDIYSVQLDDGRILAMGLYSLAIWDEPQDVEVVEDWSGYGVPGLNNAAITLPPVAIGNAVLVGIRHGGGQTIHVSFDQGQTWATKSSNIRIGDDRYNLLANPEQDALWAISSEFFEAPGSLWEYNLHGEEWTRIDDGSFPANTVRVVHDPSDIQISYALTDHGLFVSRNRGVTWESTSLTGPVHGLVFVTQADPLFRSLVAGTDTGIKVSADEAVSWSDMSKGLLSGAYTVTYADGQLIATGEGGFFTCDGISCDGPAQVFPPSDDEGLLEVVEYYNTILEHYFITASTGEQAMLDQIDPAEGWQRTGESFQALAPGQRLAASNVCRFYGSQYLGPNSHFYSDTALECRFLQQLQESIPDDQSRWNFEGWGMSVIPRAASDSQPCPEDAIPVYRGYNNGFALGKDSNHRYVTDPALLDEMVPEGWIKEGIAFCSPLE